MSSILDENTSARTLRSGKAAVGLTTRRALGEIGNRQLGGNVAAKKTLTTARSVLSNVTSRATSIVRPKPAEQELALDLPLERMLFSPKNTLADIDLPDRNDCMACTEYIEEIMEFHFKNEKTLRPSANYMSKQTDVNDRMRSILVDWLVDVGLKFKLRTETLYHTVNLIDRYLSLQSVSRNKLQLVGVVCMLIASKVEEIYAPEVRDFVYISDKAYTREEILKMESAILATLEFRLTSSTPWTFHNRFLKAAQADETTSLVSQYLLERYLQEPKSIGVLPSIVSAASVSLANRIRGRQAWTPLLEHHTTYKHVEIAEIEQELLDVARRAETSSLKAVFRKYSHQKFQEVAKLPLPESI